MKRKKTLVTGAAGFIGSHVAEHCLKSGMDVVAVDDLSGGYRGNVPDDAEWIQGDLMDESFVSQLWSEYSFDYVYHLAAYAAEGLSHFIRKFNYKNNLVASVRLLNKAIKNEADCFVFASSIAVYGENQVPMHEEMTPMPEDPYGISKYAFELDLQSAKDQFDIDYIVFRPHNVYGERQNIYDKYRNVIGIFMNQVLRGEPMTIFGDGKQTRAFSYIDDVAPIIARAPEVAGARNNIFNVGADTPHSILELAHAVADALGEPAEIVHRPARNEVKHAHADHERVKSVFDPPPPTELQIGLRRMVEWVQQQNPAEPTTFDRVEVAKNMPPSWRETISDIPTADSE